MKRSIRTKLLALVTLPVIAGLMGVGAFLAVATHQQAAEDSVRRALAVRTSAEQVTSALDGLDQAMMTKYFGGMFTSGGVAPTMDEATASLKAQVASLTALVQRDASQAALARRLGDEVSTKLRLNALFTTSMKPGQGAGGLSDLLKAMASMDPQQTAAATAAWDAPKRTLGAIQTDVEHELGTLIASAETGRHWMQFAVPIMVGAGLLASLALALLAGSRLARRVREVERNARHLADGEPLEPVTSAEDEVGRLAHELAEAAGLLASREAELRAAMIHAERASSAKSEFLSRMSHELRTPLNSILGFGQLLDMAHLEAEDADGVTKILSAGKHLLSVIDDILDISRIEAGKMGLSLEPVNIGDVVRSSLDLVRPIASARSVTIEWSGADRWAMADTRRLSQILLNLLSNAVKYNHEGGHVIVGVEAAGADRLRINVDDSGRGMDADQLGRLFTPFDRLGAERDGIEGTGLGLALSKRLAEAMDGSLGVSSEQGCGSRFFIELPVTEPRSVHATPEPSAPKRTGDRPARTVLYIEDNLANLALVERVLSRRPEVKLVYSMQGRLGLELAREHRPDLVLLDLHLPDLPGEEVLRRLMEDPATASVPVVAISADATPGRIERLREAGVRAYLTKPFDVVEFLDIVDRILGSAPAPAGTSAGGA